MQKKIRVDERREVEFRADVTNVLNHPVFAVPNTNMNSASFGQIDTAAPDGSSRSALVSTSKKREGRPQKGTKHTKGKFVLCVLCLFVAFPFELSSRLDIQSNGGKNVRMAQATRILSDNELQEVLSLRRLRFPDHPRVVDIKFEEYEDSSGENSLDIYVVLDDATPEAEWDWAHVQPVYETIRTALHEAGESRFPYFTIGTREQYERRHAYDPQVDE